MSAPRVPWAPWSPRAWESDVWRARVLYTHRAEPECGAAVLVDRLRLRLRLHLGIWIGAVVRSARSTGAFMTLGRALSLAHAALREPYRDLLSLAQAVEQLVRHAERPPPPESAWADTAWRVGPCHLRCDGAQRLVRIVGVAQASCQPEGYLFACGPCLDRLHDLVWPGVHDPRGALAG